MSDQPGVPAEAPGPVHPAASGAPAPPPPPMGFGASCGGFVLGILAGLGGFAVAANYTRLSAVGMWLVLAASTLTAIAVLVFKPLRQIGGGLVAGAAIGVILFAGVCGGLLKMAG